MTLRRLSVPTLHLIFEWNDAPEERHFAWAQAVRNMTERRIAYECVRVVGESASRLGLDWVDEEMTERYRPVCGMTVMALVWRGEMQGEASAQRMADVILAGLDAAGSEDVQPGV